MKIKNFKILGIHPEYGFHVTFQDQIKNQMYAQMNTGVNGNSMMSPLLLEVAKNGAGNIDKDQFLYSSMQEPLGTIMRLKRNNQPKGDELFKRYIARTSNMFDANDPVPSDLFIQGDTAGLKKYLLAKQIEQMKSAPGGDFTTALMYRKLTGQTADDSVSDKELMAAGMFAGQLDQSGAAVKPNDAYLMFKFLKLSSDRESGKVPAKTILEIALGDDVASIKADDFEQVNITTLSTTPTTTPSATPSTRLKLITDFSFSVSIKENSSVWLTKTVSVSHVSLTKQPSPPRPVHHTAVSTASNLTVKCNKMLL